MTRMTPLRRTILQCSQSFFTDARTFIFFEILSLASFFRNDSALRKVKGRNFNLQLTAQADPGQQTRLPARSMGQQPMPILQFNPE